MATVRGTAPAGSSVRLVAVDGSAPSVETKPNRAGAYSFRSVAAGWYVVSTTFEGSETVQEAHVGKDVVDMDALPVRGFPRLSFVPYESVLTVCEALGRGSPIDRVVIVGTFKSGMDETLRLDCPFELTSGSIGWPGSIGLTQTSQAPDELRDQIEKKRQEILKSAPPEAPLRPERVVGLYGNFRMLVGLTEGERGAAPVQTNLPPARLFGLNETDLHVIR